MAFIDSSGDLRPPSVGGSRHLIAVATVLHSSRYLDVCTGLDRVLEEWRRRALEVTRSPRLRECLARCSIDQVEIHGSELLHPRNPPYTCIVVDALPMLFYDVAKYVGELGSEGVADIVCVIVEKLGVESRGSVRLYARTLERECVVKLVEEVAGIVSKRSASREVVQVYIDMGVSERMFRSDEVRNALYRFHNPLVIEPAFIESRRHRPVQISDFVAYAIKQVVEGKTKRKGVDFLRVVGELAQSIRAVTYYTYDGAKLERGALPKRLEEALRSGDGANPPLH